MREVKTVIGIVCLGIFMMFVWVGGAEVIETIFNHHNKQPVVWHCNTDEETSVCFKSQILFDKFIGGEVNVSHSKYEGNKI